MAEAMFLNATPFRIAVNLNSQLDNRALGALSVAADHAVLQSWPAPVAAFPRQGVLGNGGQSNYLTVFSEGSAQPKVWEILSTVSVTLDLYFYVMDGEVTGVSQSGSTAGIVVQPASAAMAEQVLRSVPAAFF